MNLTELLRSQEGKTLEFKRELALASVLRTVVAFANTAGGTILIGVEDGTRQVVGIKQPLAMEERLANALSDGILPQLMPDIEILSWRTTNLLAIQVYPSPGRPHHLKAAGAQAGVYVRVGSTNRRADPELVAEMRRSVQGQPFDEQPLPALSSEVVDFNLASECFSSVRPLKRGDLETLRVLVPHQGHLVPSIGGLLLFGTPREKQVHFPDAWIQAGRFAGLDKARAVDTASLHGAFPKMLQAALEFAQKHGLQGFEVLALRRRDTWNLPLVAVREALVNAVVHADYSQRGAPIRLVIFDDRLEIESPGLLPAGLTVEDLSRGVSKLRNRVLGRVFQELGLIEQWGSGIQRMNAACAQVGLQAPLLEEIGTRFRVTLFTRARHAPQLDRLDQAILAVLAAREGMSTQAIATHIERTPRTARTRLASLVARGLVREIGSSPQDPKRLYFSAAVG